MMALSRTSFVLALFTLSSVGGCGGDSSGGSSGTALADVPGLVAAAACDAASTCLGPLLGTVLNTTDCTTTITHQVEQGDFSLVQGGVDRGTVNYDGTKVQACADAIRKTGCQFAAKRLSVLCADALSGTGKSGSSCSFGAECAPGLFCKTDQCPGTCTPLLSEGSPCTTDDECQDGLQCGGSSQQCEKPKTASFTAAEGDPCDPAASTFCKDGLACAFVQSAFQCETPATDGSCHVAFPEACPSGQYCEVTGQVTEPGTCKPLPKSGDACAPRYTGDKNPVCPPDTVCTAGTCQAPADLGGACSDDAACRSQTCKNGKCVAAECASTASSG